MRTLCFGIVDATGKVVRTGQCSPPDIGLQVVDTGCSLQRGSMAVGDHYAVSTGVKTKGAGWSRNDLADMARMKRANKLATADALVNKATDAGNAAGMVLAKTYRQALRDVTKQPDLRNITWPQEPTI